MSPAAGTREGGVCIFGPRVARAFAGDIAGGAELQMTLLARALVRRQIRCVIVDPRAPVERADDRTEQNLPARLEVLGVPRWNGGIRGIRFLTHRLPSLLQTLLSCRASLYYVRGFSFISIVPWCAARLRRARFVLAVASDADLLPFRERYRTIYRRRSGLWDWIAWVIPNELTLGFLQRYADLLLVQHEGQAEIASNRGLKAVICRNIVELDATLDSVPAGAGLARGTGADFEADADLPDPASRGSAVVMVGTLSRYKGLDPVPDLVRSLPEVDFVFIGRATDKDGERIREALAGLPNAKLLGPLSRTATLRQIAGAKALLNTSLREGFPNTFLEAWMAGTPVLSLHVDPGGILERHGLGIFCNHDLARLAAELRRPDYRLNPGTMRAYVREHHSGDAAVSVLLPYIL